MTALSRQGACHLGMGTFASRRFRATASTARLALPAAGASGFAALFAGALNTASWSPRGPCADSAAGALASGGAAAAFKRSSRSFRRFTEGNLASRPTQR
eukprot:scaffold3970_cov257-Pinguiococcus_pyrenoidosus.AAC.6